MESQSPDNNEGAHPLLHRTFIFLNLSCFLVFFNISLFYLFPLALNAMGSESHVIGGVMGLFSIAAVLSRPFMGKMAAGKGEYWIMCAGMALILPASLGYNFIHKVGPAMLIIRIIHGIGFSAFIAGSFSLVARIFPHSKRGEAYSMVGASLMGAVALGPAVGEYLIRLYGFRTLYLASSAAILLAWLSIFLSNSSTHPLYNKNRGESRYLPLLKDRSFLFLLISTLIFAHCQSSVVNFLALIARQKGVNSGQFFFLSFLLAILVLLTMGKIMDRYGKLLFLRLSYPFLALGILFIPLLLHYYHALVPALLYGAGMGLLFPAHNALAAGHGTDREKPAVMSVFTTIYDTGFITGAVVSGWIAGWTDLDMLFYSVGGLGLAGFLIVIFAPIRDN